MYEQGCKGGYGLGCANLALMYENGRATLRDNKRAQDLFRQACEQRGCMRLKPSKP